MEIYDKIKSKGLFIYTDESKASVNIQKYRKVFDENEISYIYVDFIFINKLFDEENWEGTFTFKVYNVSGDVDTIITTLNKDADVHSGVDEMTVTASWGQDKKAVFWNKGKYKWEVYYNNLLLWKEDFFIEDFGEVTRENNTYFHFNNLTVFEASSTIPAYDDRNYYSRFQFDATRFIYAEFEFQNLHPKEAWKGEFTFNYYNDVKERVGRVQKIENVVTDNKNNSHIIFGGIGSDTDQTWSKDIYTIEVIFMGIFIASVQFEVGETPNKTKLIVDAPKKNEGNALLYSNKLPTAEKEIFNEIDSLIGLENIKKKLHEYYYFVKYLKLREEKGIKSEEKINLNFVFSGNPGTGKTTVAKLLGKIYKELGLLEKSTVYEVDRGDLIGRYIGETAPQTKEIIKKARGGVLFIDEAYSLWREDDSRDFGREAVEVLIKELSDGPGNIAIIVAGYPKEMKEFIESNPGLKSRFNVWYEFQDYLPDELFRIANFIANKKLLQISDEANKPLKKIIIDAYRKRDRTFGNARFVQTIIEQTQMNLGLRVMKSENMQSLTKEDISTINKSDVETLSINSKNVYPDFPIDDELLKKSLNEFNELIGLENVKSEVKEMVKLVRFYKESKKDVLNSFSLHNVFIGNPGTGKTTVARILANIYKALGLLERGHLLECGKDSLVAGYVGQTAIKTSEKIEEAMGGVLFIDEAYALSASGGNSFGAEAVEVILKAMEDYRGKFSLITAGYVDEMTDFLDSNPGLKSRFDNFIYFDDYTIDELFEIAIELLNKSNLKLEKNAEDNLRELIKFRFERKDKFFGNARFIRRIIDKIIRNQNLRLSDISQKERTKNNLSLIIEADIESLIEKEDYFPTKNKTIGF